MNAIQQNLYGNYRNRKFTDIWGDVNVFLKDYTDNGIAPSISNASATTLFYLLYARYGNSTVASSDETQFKYKVFSTIFMYGPTWEKRLQIQKGVRELLSEDSEGNLTLSPDILDGGKAVYNTALNPGQAVAGGQAVEVGEGTNTLDELTYINQQNTTRYKKSKIDAYSILTNMLQTDVTADFINQFKKLFLVIVSPELPLWYRTPLEDDNND